MLLSVNVKQIEMHILRICYLFIQNIEWKKDKSEFVYEELTCKEFVWICLHTLNIGLSEWIRLCKQRYGYHLVFLYQIKMYSHSWNWNSSFSLCMIRFYLLITIYKWVGHKTM